MMFFDRLLCDVGKFDISISFGAKQIKVFIFCLLFTAVTLKMKFFAIVECNLSNTPVVSYYS